MTKLFFNTSNVKSFLKDQKPSSIVIVTSKNIFNTNKWIFNLIKNANVIFVKDGEEAKTFEELEKLLKQFLRLDKKAVVIAIGGGSIGDLVGFASSIYLRRIKFINIPTTLLAQVDSAHGGKNGINFAGYKNQIGTINEADAIFIDSKFINTLSRKQVIDGLGEIIKYGFIKDKSILKSLDKGLKNIDSVIKKSIACKYYFTDKDLNEKNIRAILNVGHTFGHAIELKYKISHGLAVIIGMLKEFEFTERLGFSEKGLKDKLEGVLEKMEIKIDANKYKIDKKSLIHDKKIKGNKINFPIVKKPGLAYIKEIDLNIIK
jgi:3-dehydroquinate synthase